MNAPNRSATVHAFYKAHPEFFTAERHDENRRRSLPFLIEQLEATHREDVGRWGVLVKHNQNDKIPCDVLVWRDTGEHFDVVSSTEGIWIPHGPISVNGGDNWFWAPYWEVNPDGSERALHSPPYVVDGGSQPEPQPGPTPQPEPDSIEQALTLIADALVLINAQLEEQHKAQRAVLAFVSKQVADLTTYVATTQHPNLVGDIDLGFLGRRQIKLRQE